VIENKIVLLIPLIMWWWPIAINATSGFL